MMFRKLFFMMGSQFACMAGSPNEQPAADVHCRNVSVRLIMTCKGGIREADRFTAVGIMLWG